jgi:tRNA threonylcarbamoyladenosine biosynthesis protein TsaE
MNTNYTEQQLTQVAADIIQNSSGKTLLFYGSMGVGKTTLIKEIAKQLEIEDVVCSPTFSIVNEYHSAQGDKLYHFDFYRIENEEEAMDIGLEDYLYNDDWCLIEWPEKVKNLLPLNAVEIYLTKNEDESRNIVIK